MQISNGLAQAELQTLLGERLFEKPQRLACQRALACLRARHVKVPEALSFVTHDEMPWSALIAPSLTSVQQPFAEMGAKAAELILQRLDAKAAVPPQRIVVPSQLVIRESCGWFLRVADGDPAAPRNLEVPSS